MTFGVSLGFWGFRGWGFNVNLTSINGVATVIFAGPEGLSRRLLSITGGFRADVCKQVYIGGSGENNNGVTTVIFGRPGIRNFTCREDFSSSESKQNPSRPSTADPDS